MTTDTDINFVDECHLDPGPSALGPAVAAVFETETALLIRFTSFPSAAVQQVRGIAEGCIPSKWHHHRDNHVFGYVIEGEGYVPRGRADDDRRLASAGQFFHIPPVIVHLDVNPMDDD